MADNYLKWLRRALALLTFCCIVALFCDTTGAIRSRLGFLVDIQFFPSVASGFFVSWILILAFTFLFGRFYCSIICPLGIMQDFFAWIGRIGGKKRKIKYSYSQEKTKTRFSIMALFIICAPLPFFAAALFTAMLEPYSIFGRIATTMFAPISRAVMTHLAESSAEAGEYAYEMPAILNMNYIMLGIAIAFLVLIAVLSFRNGRTYCNTICPVGTFLSIFAERSVMGIKIDEEKCKHCGLCARKCKASCIDAKTMSIDASRCVDCMDCIDSCSSGAISFGKRDKKSLNFVERLKESFAKKSSTKKENTEENIDTSKRAFLTVGAMLGGAALMDAKAKITDGGLAPIAEKEEMKREEYITPPGSISHAHIGHVCTACGLCITACPNRVLRPSSSLEYLLTPVMSYENGYCRPECNKCGEVCPTGAINLVSIAKKSAIHIGHAVLASDRCVAANGEASCGNCARHCPVNAITMVALADNPSRMIPNIDSERCIGCGACEYLCPSRPLSAIYVEGHRVHREDVGECE